MPYIIPTKPQSNPFPNTHAEIAKDEWVREVTESSMNCWVAVLLYLDSQIECRLLEEKLIILAGGQT